MFTDETLKTGKMLRISSLFRHCYHSILHQSETIGRISWKLFLLNQELLYSGYNYRCGKDINQKNITINLQAFCMHHRLTIDFKITQTILVALHEEKVHSVLKLLPISDF